jgi:branched-chain amino acid transport system substrate-binding protein
VRRPGQFLSGALLALGLLPAQCSREPAHVVELKVGEIDSLSGVLAAQGTAVHEGVVFAVSEVNRQGGVHGRLVRLVTRDDGGQPDAATNAAHDLAVREKVSALVGGYVDSIVGPVAQVAERERVPYVASSSLDQRLTQRGNSWFFRISRLEPFVEATTAVPLGILPARNVAILYSSTPGATQLARLQKERLEALGVKVSAFESFQTGTPDFIPLLARVRSSGATMLLMDGFFADNLVLLRQIHTPSGPPLPVVGAFGMEFPALIRQLGPLGEGAMGAIVWEPGLSLSGDLEGSRSYETGFEKEFGHPPAPLSMYGYTAARAVLAALQRTARGDAPSDREAVRDALRQTDLLLPLERLRFDQHGDPLFYRVGIFQIQNGRHVLLYPPEKATGEPLRPNPWTRR